ncbi:Pyruvate/2-oxoglutarate dehydrogenase complex, dihydrolipoamide acyltransferase (E2) component or related enzyme [Halalkaliarchaeum sp. AArc-CO]|uniref:OsmC family protein n=1 Tax=Halalkaliarchaeum sp. AArc-CO TaxID=2866381 RepID=UPI00217DB688|nr:OsmC family protein [Halalkaliarchaeum sp. AArc-CO]UWG50417.1 Pyruvate/2-oxoglutarate dehydrogenase complex, dihydrolipoamide acyltransferase (E2) component or related enzyme [Halalkaliarchaeum sp. AArc-CO]
MAHLVEIPPTDGTPATVREWVAAVGDSLSAGDPIVDLAIDGTERTITAPVDGTLTHRLLSEDESAGPGSALAIVGSKEEPTVPERAVTADVDSDYAGTVTAGSFAWRIDSGDDLDGGTAPSPVDLFLGGLASCLAVSIAVQADIRNVELAGVSVDAAATPTDGSVESIALQVHLDPGDQSLEEAVLERIVTVGERTCHVAELLRADLPIDLSWEQA